MLGDTGAEIDRLTASVRVDMRSLSERLDTLQAYVVHRKSAAVAAGVAPGKPIKPAPSQKAQAAGAPAGAAYPKLLRVSRAARHAPPLPRCPVLPRRRRKRKRRRPQFSPGEGPARPNRQQRMRCCKMHARMHVASVDTGPSPHISLPPHRLSGRLRRASRTALRWSGRSRATS